MFKAKKANKNEQNKLSKSKNTQALKRIRRMRQRRNKDIVTWFFIQSAAYVIAAVLAFVFVEYMTNQILTQNPNYNPWNAVGMIAPMIIFIGTVSLYHSFYLLKRISTLTESLFEISNGNFAARVDVKKAGPLRPVYMGFNRMGAELEKVEILKQDFINSYSHEFKTPISSIKGFAELLLQKDITESERNAYLKIIVDESARLSELANSTILLSKLDSQGIITDKTLYSLDEQLRQCAIMCQSEWSKKNLALHTDLKRVSFFGNPDIMSHIWQNLLSNAIKYTKSGGEIFIRLFEDDSDIFVIFTDSGVGMTPDEITHIFEKYYQCGAPSAQKGLGLGLSIVKRIVELCNGVITVESHINIGTTFTVRLPKYHTLD